MRGRSLRIHLFVIIVVLVLVELGGIAPASGSSVYVYDHGFAKQLLYVHGNIVPVNRTSSFTQDDLHVYAFMSAAFYSANFTQYWYDPSGNLYYHYSRQAECVATPCSLSSTLTVAGTSAATRFGLWRMDMLADGQRLFSDYFSLASVITQNDYWSFDVRQSAPPRVHGDLTVTIFPNNGTWNFYVIALPNVENVTAHDSSTNQTLKVTTYPNGTYYRGWQGWGGLIIVDFSTPRPKSYTFVLSFDVKYGLHGDWYGGNFFLPWEEYSWQRVNDAHAIPETFNITLPQGATVVDNVGTNVMTLNFGVASGVHQSVSFSTTLMPGVRSGWTIIYHDYTYHNSFSGTASTTAEPYVPMISGQLIPILPISLGSVSLWTAIMSVFLMTGSELLSPIYSRTGILLNRRRLRIAALILVVIFLISTGYQIALSMSPTLFPK